MHQLFFKGRKDARQSHVKHGFKSSANLKAGSKKYPLTLIVTSEARKKEVEALAADASLYAEVSVDNQDGAVESIAELTTLLDTSSTVKVEKTQARNEPCSCGSGKKFKKCCG
jgi:SWIM/SEC-C metal-binding protein